MGSILRVDGFGNKRWKLNGKFHREDGPACEYTTGYKAWLINDRYHREDGPAIIHSDGGEEWYQHGKLHREGGPAIISFNIIDGYAIKKWYLNGKRHRVDGPAITQHPSGINYWFLDGNQYSYEEWFSKLTPEQQYNYLWNLDE